MSCARYSTTPVRDEEVGHPQSALQWRERVEDLRLHRDVEGGGRLVADDELRLDRQRAGDRDALLLAAGEFVREAVHRLGPQADLLQQGGGALAPLGSADLGAQRCYGLLQDLRGPRAQTARDISGHGQAFAPVVARYAFRMRQVIIYRGEDGYWVAECPSLPGCVSQGETREAAIANIREAIEGYVLALQEDGLPVPEEHFDAMLLAV